MMRTWVILLAVAWAGVAGAQEKKPDVPVPPPSAERAELDMLRKTVARLTQENRELKRRVDDLVARLKTRGEYVMPERIAPAPTQAEAQPVEAPETASVADAKRIVVVVDATGSMLNKFEKAKGDAINLIQSLHDDQFFGVVIIRDGNILTLDANILPVNRGTKTRAVAFITKTIVRGPGSISKGIESALRYTPQVIWYAGDGDDDDAAAEARAIAERAKRAGARIHTSVVYGGVDSRGKVNDRLILLTTLTGGKCYDPTGREIIEGQLPRSQWFDN